jgi:hypothetical protein
MTPEKTEQNLPSIESRLNSKELFVAFKMQLAKDFNQSDFPSDFIDRLEPIYETLLKTIATELQQNDKQADSKIMRLLNRVDISEPRLKKYLSENKDKGYFNVVAELIIKRVLQKVVIKKHYRNLK